MLVEFRIKNFRSLRDEHRVALKIETIEYYGLWASAEPDKTARNVFTMLASSAAEEAAPMPVPFKEAILAHIWPSVLAPKALDACGLLCLPEGFHVNPRNFRAGVFEHLINATLKRRPVIPEGFVLGGRHELEFRHGMKLGRHVETLGPQFGEFD
jgi:hypothetical protein